MKKLNKKKILSVMVSMLMTSVASQSISVYASDIDIYSNSTGGRTTITMMLDTSGSMSESQVGASACELASGTSYTSGSESSGTTPTYTKYYCQTGGGTETRYYYKRGPVPSRGDAPWYKCGNPYSTSMGDCIIQSNAPSSTLGFSSKRNNSGDSCRDRNDCYYYKDELLPIVKYYDRLTKLKDAIFTLMDSNQLESNSVAIGIGQFSSQSGNDNVYTGADGASGKILVPAALLTNAQRTAIKTAVANLRGTNGTPTANAYAEVAAYMLGKSTTTTLAGLSEDYIAYPNDTSYYNSCVVKGFSCSNLTSPQNWIYGRPNGYTLQKCSSFSWANGATSYCWVRQKTLSTAENIYSGFSKSVNTSKVGSSAAATNYQTPLSTNSTQCNGQGIYFLTDGEPNSSPMPEPLMKAALGVNGSSFNIPATGTLPAGTQNGHGMPAVGEFAKALRNTAINPLGLEIKTAVVGFGSVFHVDRTVDATKPVAQRIIRTLDYINSRGERTNQQRDYYNCSLISDVDAQNACNWGAKSHPDLPSSVGGYGEGGFYSAQSTDDVVESIIKFLDDVKPEFEPLVTGSPTLPQDALNPLRIQPYGYYASFIPKPQEAYQLWAGNLNKYHILNGELFAANKTTRLIKPDGTLNKNANGIWTDGVTGKLPLGIELNLKSEKIARRTLFTNRQITGTVAPYVATEASSLKQVNIETLFSTDADKALFANDGDKNYWLNLLGYNVSATAVGITLDNLSEKPELRQLGAVMHSKPILLTQEGKITVNANGELDTTDRKDYLLFGSTQGLLHVVDKEGKEVFAFVPHEMMRNQKNAFLAENSTIGGKSNLFYGIDAPWTAYTQYVAKSDNTLTVSDSGRKVQNSDDGDEIALKGLQWVYGGLRMGGRSYYALDLSDITGSSPKPELKFHINPDAATTDASALYYMGQSWSKPTVAYVRFGGEKKLVMFVGGGYDATGSTTACNVAGDTVAKNIGYECDKYNQDNGKGAGVYMFDAHDGSLLWWASSNATAAKGATAYKTASDMKFSVVSQINTIDRDNDGLIDHLYFGDLGGQGWRIDLDNNASTTSNFSKHVVRLFNKNVATGASPRFYEMPSVSIHEDSGYVAAVAFSSGNRSSPLVGTVGKNNLITTTSAVDAVFVVYDKDVAKTDLYDLRTADLTTQNISFTSLNDNFSTGVPIVDHEGWTYTYASGAGVYKGMNEIYALDGMLYANVYHRDGKGVGGDCGAGVKGDTYLYQFCLPTGKCSKDFYKTGQTEPNRVIIGGGIMGAGLGQGNGELIRLIVNRDEELDCNIAINKNLPQCQKFSTTAKIRQLRWYETR